MTRSLSPKMTMAPLMLVFTSPMSPTSSSPIPLLTVTLVNAQQAYILCNVPCLCCLQHLASNYAVLLLERRDLPSQSFSLSQKTLGLSKSGLDVPSSSEFSCRTNSNHLIYCSGPRQSSHTRMLWLQSKEKASQMFPLLKVTMQVVLLEILIRLMFVNAILRLICTNQESF